MNVKAFFVDALARALDLEIATPEDVLRHMRPEVLAQHLPRPLWARLLTACLGAPRVDAQLVVETVGVANLCEHVPADLIWACILDVAKRALGVAATDASETPTKVGLAQDRSVVRPVPVQIAPPPPEAPIVAKPGKSGPVITVPARPIPPVGQQPLADIIDDLEQDRPATARPGTQPRFRQAQTASGRSTATQPATAARRPQAAAPVSLRSRRGNTEADQATETDVSEIAVDDSQLVDWQSAEETQTTHDDFSRKR